MDNLETSLLDALDEGYPLPETETSWGKRRQDIRNHMNSKDDWSGFLDWPVVIASLFTGQIPNTDAELRELEGSECYDALNDLGFIPWNGTAIHQAHLLWWAKGVRRDHRVAEFGGGYGEMYRVLHALGHTGDYYVYDFPELLTLQEYYLTSNEVPLDRWHPCYTKGQWLEKALCSDLFVSVCALSEAPEDIRWMVAGITPERLAIRYQPRWDGVNNTEWLYDYAHEHDMIATTENTPEYTNHFLMLMERK